MEFSSRKKKVEQPIVLEPDNEERLENYLGDMVKTTYNNSYLNEQLREAE